jgi:hypothetical protein
VDNLPVNRGQVFLPHSRWIMFSQVIAIVLAFFSLFPQLFPQAAHNVAGVLHTLSTTSSTARVGISSDGPRKCQSHRLERCQT